MTPYNNLTIVLPSVKILTMNGLSTITSKGQITIPHDIRSLMNIQKGDYVLFKKTQPALKQIVIRVVPTKNVVEKLYGSLKTKIKETDHVIARQKSGEFLVKKYHLQK